MTIALSANWIEKLTIVRIRIKLDYMRRSSCFTSLVGSLVISYLMHKSSLCPIWFIGLSISRAIALRQSRQSTGGATTWLTETVNRRPEVDEIDRIGAPEVGDGPPIVDVYIGLARSGQLWRHNKRWRRHALPFSLHGGSKKRQQGAYYNYKHKYESKVANDDKKSPQIVGCDKGRRCAGHILADKLYCETT